MKVSIGLCYQPKLAVGRGQGQGLQITTILPGAVVLSLSKHG